MFNVSYFCAVGNPCKQNQDRVLVNGHLIEDGLFNLEAISQLSCFVADGVGSMANSGNAAQFVLEMLAPLGFMPQSKLSGILPEINQELVHLNRQHGLYIDSATTLCGLMLDETSLQCVNIGDSEILVCRNGAMVKVTTPQVLDEHAVNSPITSYMGSRIDKMCIDFKSTYLEYQSGDIIIVTTDGLLKAIDLNGLCSIFLKQLPLAKRVEMLYYKLTSKDVPDNLGVIIIEAAEMDK
jgi:serine/threonine protein phosphatase PrpC